MGLDISIAVTRKQRVRGLRGRDALRPREALLIPRCRAVHTVGMRFTIAVCFLDSEGRVFEVVEAGTGRVLRPRIRARHVLECAPCDAPPLGTMIPLA